MNGYFVFGESNVPLTNNIYTMYSQFINGNIDRLSNLERKI